MVEPNNMLDDMAFEEQLTKLSGDELNRFVARTVFATTKRCSLCVKTVVSIEAKIGEFDEVKKGSLDDRLSAIENRDRRHLQISTAAGAGGGAGLSILLQGLWTMITSPHK